MRRTLPLASLALVVLALAAAAPRGARAASTCGNGVVDGGEECDPGPALYCNGDPAQGACTTGAQCESGVNCYGPYSCCKFNCQFVGQGADCFDGNACTVDDRCDFVGRCVGKFAADGAPCDDGTFCNGADSCRQGECSGHAGDPCAAATDCLATCDEAAGRCASTPLVPCRDDGNACTADVCDGSGVCTHPPLPAGETCRAAATVCDVAETCAGGGAPCPADAVVPDGTACGDQCTDNGACLAGVCANGVPKICDDANACNGLESCDPDVGCLPGTPLDCDDADSCTDDGCDGAAGCTHAVRPDGAPCDDGDACTGIDVCAGGACRPGPHFLAADFARIGPRASVGGNLAVNAPDGLAKFSREARMDDGTRATANTARLAALASVDDLAANLVKASPTAVVRGTLAPATLPVVPAWCAMPSGGCGGPPVVVPTGEVIRIAPGVYGDVLLTQRATLELDPGTYELCSLRAVSPNAIRARGDVVVRVRGSMKLGRYTILEPYAGTTELWVARAARISTSAIVRAGIRVPDAALLVGRYATVEGSVCADVLKTSREARLGCPAAAP